MGSKKNFPLRIDPKLYDDLERWAADELRSVNSLIEYVLRDALRRAGRNGRPEPRGDAEAGNGEQQG